jgi:hypothetical protein
MRVLLVLLIPVIMAACHKQVGGPRKLTAVGHIEYSFATNIITTVFYKDDPSKIFTIRINRDHTISEDVSGTWAESGAQILLNIEGDFGPASPLDVDFGYYESRDFIEIEGHEVNMRDFADKIYFIAVSHGTIAGDEYYRQFVFE